MNTKEKMMNVVLIFFGISLAISLSASVNAELIYNTTPTYGLLDSYSGSWTSVERVCDGSVAAAAVCGSHSSCWAICNYTVNLPEDGFYINNIIALLDYGSTNDVDYRKIYIYNFSGSVFDEIYYDEDSYVDVLVKQPVESGYILNNTIRLNLTLNSTDGQISEVSEISIANYSYYTNIDVISPLYSDLISESEDVNLEFTVFTSNDSYATCNYTVNTTTSSSFNVTNNTLYSTNIGKHPIGTNNITVNCTEDGGYYYYSSNFTIVPNYFNITVSDEMDDSPMTFNITISNSTTTYTWTEETEFYENVTNPDIPTGEITITISAYGYEDRVFNELFYDDIPPVIEEYYLLSSSDGSLTRFHVEDSGGSVIVNVDVNAYRTIGGTESLIDDSNTDDTGVATFWLDPTATYTMEFIKVGYTSINYTLVASSSDYTIIMSSLEDVMAVELLTNITFKILPQNNVTNSSINNVTYSFYINSTDSKLEWFSLNVTHDGVNLYNDNITDQPEGGTISQDLNMSLLDCGKTVIVTAMFKKVNITTPFNITHSYFIWKEGSSVGTDLKSIADLLRLDLDLDNTDSTNKIFMSIGIIIFSMIAGAIVSNTNGSGMMGIIVLGIGLSMGLLSFAGTGTGIIFGTIFGLMILAFVSVMYLRSGL